jgi:curved DNA-binding protein CbpA
MGNTPTKDKHESAYSDYIRQQQELILKQQQQINSLYQYNLDNQQYQSDYQRQQQVPSNIRLQMDPSNPMITEKNLPRLGSGTHSTSGQKPSQKMKLDPYKILNIPKQYDEKTLKKAYLRAAMKTHPDRGGSQDAFQKVSIAYAVLTKKLSESQNSHSHDDLRKMSREHTRTQDSQPMMNVDMKDNFDVNLFNKIYSDNRINDVYDDGYGSWMNKNQVEDVKMIKGDEKMFQNNFNKDLFNDTFEKYKREQSQKQGQQVIQYQDPEVRMSIKNQDSIMTLGQGKIGDFGGTTDNLSYTDYKKAFTDGSTLIDVNTVDITTRSANIDSMESQRSNISYTMNREDERFFAIQKKEEQKAEQNRLQRLQKYDQQHGESYEKIHAMLLR